MRQEFDDTSYVIKVSVIIIGVVILMFGSLIFLFLFDIADHLEYKHSVKTKEDVFQMVEEHQDEYIDLVQNMEIMLQESEEKQISCNETEYHDKGFESKLFKEYPIYSVYTRQKDDNTIVVDVELVFPPSPYSYWGVYYSSADEPYGWGHEAELQEENGIYIEYGSYYKYETEKIVEHWYYYQCYTR